MSLKPFPPVRLVAPEPEHSPIENGAYDKVCVRDLVLPVHIGVWDDELQAAQPVRFTVEIWAALGHRPGDLSSVISYDFIIGGIKDIVGQGHVQLAETLAERIAAHCLSHRRALKVRVSVEKTGRIPGASLGCEIVRLARGDSG